MIGLGVGVKREVSCCGRKGVDRYQVAKKGTKREIEGREEETTSRFWRLQRQEMEKEKRRMLTSALKDKNI